MVSDFSEHSNYIDVACVSKQKHLYPTYTVNSYLFVPELFTTLNTVCE